MDEINIGQLIEQRRRELKIPKTVLGPKVGMTRQAVGMIMYSASIRTHLLQKFCIALNYDFFQHYVLQKNEDIKKLMQEVIDQKQKEIDALKAEAEQMKKILEEKNFAIDVLRGKK